SWDTSDPAHPVLTSVAHMPNGPLEPAQRAHEQYGIMEDAKTWPDATKYQGGLESKGMFAGSMCGGGVFFTPDVTKLKGDASSKWNQVWNDGLSEIALAGQGNGEFDQEPGGCAGGAWHQVTPSNTYLFRGIQGRNPGSDNYFDTGQGKMIYNIDIRDLIKSAQDGHVTCDLSRGIHEDGIELTGIQLFNKLAKGEKIADCPTLNSELEVNDPTTGGPHWAALDNHSVDQRGIPWRLMFSDYFVSRTGVDGDHRAYTVNVSPTAQLSYDKSFRDEQTGALGINFNRRNWPGSPDAGFYKPHSMIWVCPPGVCTDATQISRRPLDDGSPASPSGDLGDLPGSRAAEIKCQRTSSSGQVKARKIPGFGRVRVRLQGNSSAPAGTPLYVTVLGGSQLKGVGYKLDGTRRTASGKAYRLAITPRLLRNAGRHTITVTLRSASGATKTITLRFKTLACNAVLSASQNKRGTGSLLRLRVDSLKALTKVAFKIPAATLAKAKAAVVRVRNSKARAKRFTLRAGSTGLTGKPGSVAVRINKGTATLTGLPENAGIVRINIRSGAKPLSTRVLHALAVAGGRSVLLKAKLKR
ncbi:MAG: hypothetical protein QOF76_2389, partial [Solirubrobacteraceae bacterium]|nr:hypothetical protein [Solirubrobacteraceae bacterium]